MKIPEQDVWKWAYADFLPNAQRGVLAEYIVALAVGAASTARKMWDAVDVVSPTGLQIEVKSASYLQAWRQTSLSRIRFDIAPKRVWEEKSRQYSEVASRRAAVYVFALFETIELEKADPLELGQWSFRTCSCADLEREFGAQRSVSLAALDAIGLRRLSYQDLCSELRALGA